MRIFNSNKSSLIRSFLEADRKSIVCATIASVIGGACSASLIAFIGRQVSVTEKVDLFSALVFAFLLFISVASSLYASKMLVAASSLHSYNLRLELCRRVLGTPYTIIEKIDKHRLIASLSEDLNAIVIAFSGIPTLISNFTKVLFCLMYLLWLAPSFVAVLAVFLLPIVYIQIRLFKRTKRKMEFMLPIRDHRYGLYRLLTDGIKELNIDARLRQLFYQDQLLPNAAAFRRALQDMSMAREYAAQWGQSTYFVVVFGLIVIVPLGYFEPNAVASFALIGLYLRGSINSLLQVVPVWIAANTAMKKINSLGLSASDRTVNSLLANSSDVALSSDICVELKDVCYHYEDFSAGSPKLLGPYNLQFNQGEIVFITGGNGSGKTTLTKLLVSMYKPTRGHVSFNRQTVDEHNESFYKSHFYIVFSDYCLFEDQLENYQKDDEQIFKTALSKLHLEDEVLRNDETQKLANLSTGQQSRLALIPALLTEKPVLVFDEWAANQDPEFKQIFYFELLPELKQLGKLVIVISHDDRYFEIADRLIKLENSTIRED